MNIYCSNSNSRANHRKASAPVISRGRFRSEKVKTLTGWLLFDANRGMLSQQVDDFDADAI